MPDLSVTIDDQKGICKYSSYLMDQATHTNTINRITKEIGGLEDALRELDLVLDEDEPINFAFGSGTIEMSFDEARSKIEEKLAEKRAELGEAREEQAALEVQMSALKRVLVGKFGNTIRLD